MRVPKLEAEDRERLMELSVAWKEAARLSSLPISFEGIDGKTLVTRQYVGVIESGDVAIEIYPKLDKGMAEDRALAEGEAKGVLDSLLYLLEASGYDDLVETGDGSLTESPESFPDLFALLMARKLSEELSLGVPRSYERFEDDLKAVRGRLLLGQQATRNFERWDRLACAFDEFTPDIALCRILRCACRELLARVRHSEARRCLEDCLGLLDEVGDISIPDALHLARVLPPWSRGQERFRRPYALAVRLLRGLSHDLSAGSAETFVFLLDMNEVFEAFVAAALEARFGGTVETQKSIGTLLTQSVGGIHQKPDYLWNVGGVTWIGDAKYKHLTEGQISSLTFEDDGTIAAGKRLSPDDIRQLTVYAEMVGKRSDPAPPLALFYPFIGEGKFEASTATAWNGSSLSLVPVHLDRNFGPSSALPPFPNRSNT